MRTIYVRSNGDYAFLGQFRRKVTDADFLTSWYVDMRNHCGDSCNDDEVPCGVRRSEAVEWLEKHEFKEVTA